MIERDVARAAQREFDLLIVGGGIYGASLLQAAARRGVSACLCEAHDYGGGTSQNSLRILHGGLRYLQTLDLPRFFQSVTARRGVARQFPSLVRPLSCLMPLYGPGLKRPAVVRVALALNDALSLRRNAGLPKALHLGRGEILSATGTRRRFPAVRSPGLLGAARWDDYFMVSSERILIELLLDACRRGAAALNYAGVERLVLKNGAVTGALVRDAVAGGVHELRARTVVNCTGPSAAKFANGHGNSEGLFLPSLAFNVLLDATLEVDSAVAVAAPAPGAPVLFLVPQRATVLAGTMHLPRPPGTLRAEPTSDELESYLAHLRAAIPGFDVRMQHVLRVFAGLLPARVASTPELAKREMLVDHGGVGGPRRFFSVSGVKYTTAGLVATRVLRLLGYGAAPSDADVALPISAETPLLTDARRLWDDAAANAALRSTVAEEAVQSVDDLVQRRTNWFTTEPDSDGLRARVLELVPELRALEHARRA